MNNFHIYAFIKQVAILFPTFVLLFTVRGFFQAWAAYFSGDDTAHEEGFLTLNPLAHVDVLGALIFAAFFGGMQYAAASGSSILVWLFFALILFTGVRPYYPVPIDSSYFRWPRLGVVITTLSGTVSYLLLTLMSMYTLLIGFDLCGGMTPLFLIVQQIANSIIEWSMFWAVLSLIPIPPFDAGALLPVFLGEVGQKIYDFLEPYGLLILITLLWVPGVREIFLAGFHAVHLALYQGLMQLIFI